MSSQPVPENPLPLRSDDPLDRLLLSAPLVEPDGWFAARTIARCRHSAPSPSFFAWKPFWPRWVIGGAFGLFLGAFGLQQVHHSEKVVATNQRHVQEAFEVLASLDSDSDTEAPDQESSF